MSEVIALDDHRPHVTINGTSGKVHVIPVSTIQDVIEGARDITSIEDYEDIVPSILIEWLDYLERISDA